MSESNSEVIQSHCNGCMKERDHHVLHTRKHRFDAEGPELKGVFWENTYYMVECCGCHTVSIQLAEFFSEAANIGDPGTRVTHSPPPAYRPFPHWIDNVPQHIRHLHEEVYKACTVDARALATMGIRAIIDEVGTDKLFDCLTFKLKVDKLCEKGLISEGRKKVLLEAFDTGSAAAHRAYCPPPDVLADLLDIAEHLLMDMYVLEDIAIKLSKTTPKRENG